MTTNQTKKKVNIGSGTGYGQIMNENPEWVKHRPPEYWEYRKGWVEYPKSGKTPNFPLCINIETTNVCNLKCGMCPRTVLISRGTYSDLGLMKFDLYRKIIDQGEKYNLPSVKLQYLGEPLAHRDLAKQIKYAKDAGVLDVMFNTNATLLTEEKSHQILEAGLDAIFFSFDSMDPDTYNKIRVGASFDKVMDNIHKFLEIKRKNGYTNVHTRVSMTVDEQGIEDLDNFKNYWLKYVDGIGFGIYNNVTEDETIDESPYNPNFGCEQPFQRLFIMWDGIMTPCCKDDNRHYKLGDANVDDIYSIWHGERLSWLRNKQLSGNYRDVNICKNCYRPHSYLDGEMIPTEKIKENVEELRKKQNSIKLN